METFPITKKTEEISREKYISKSFRQFLALLLCAAMLMPIFPSPVSATGTTDSTVATDGTEATQEEKAAPEETEPEWVLPECDCGSTEAELGKHGETCALKAFLEKFCEETAAEIYSKWDKLPEECQKYVLEYLGQNPDYAQKLAELNGYIDAAQAATEATEATTEATEATTEATEDATEEAGMLLGGFGLFASYPDIGVTNAISLPGYPARKVSKTVEYDCGNGVANDGSKSYLTIVTETNSDEFIAYTQILKESGYKLKDEKIVEIDSNVSGVPNRFASYTSPDGKYKLYTYHLPAYNETRIIVDTQADTVEGYRYEPQKGVSVEPKLVMWGLSTSPSGYHIDTTNTGYATGRENNGVLLIMRMKDNSLFFYDGGILAQMSDAESAELLAFCRELTGTKVGEKMVINTWFVSHAHDDHFQAFGRFININHAHFDLKNVVYNIDLERGDLLDLDSGNKSTTPASKKLREALDVIRQHYSDVNYYKPHTGETFDVAGIKFDVLYTHEDRLVPDTWTNKLSFEEDQLAQNRIDIWDIGGTYRTELYKDYNTKRSDFNDTSTVLRVNFENGVDSILYADLNLAEDILKKVYPASELKTDIMMVPHHGFDAHPDLVTYAASRVYLYAQNKLPIYGIDDNYTTNDANDRDDLRENFASNKNAMDSASGTEGTDYDIFWGGSETVNIDINALGQVLGYTPSARVATSGDYYTVEPATSFTYTGDWGITTPASAEYQSVVSSVEDELAMEKAVPVPVSNHQIVFTPHGDRYFVQEGRYLLMSDAYGHIMFFDSTAVPEVAPGEQYGTSTTGSIKLDADGNSENTYYLDSNGNVILDHSDRHFVLWNMRQYYQATGGTTLANGVNLMASSNTTFKGTAQFAGVELQKRTNAHDSYWYSKYFEEDVVANKDFQLRFFCFKSDTTAFKNHYRNSLQTTNNDVYGDQSGSRVKFILDSLGDGTYMLYFKESNTDYRVVTCDANGKWDVVRYRGGDAVANMKADKAKLVLRLYDYKETDANKAVAFSGYQTYKVTQGAAVDSILTDISNNITVFDSTHQNQHIPYDGSEVTKTNIYGTEYPVTKKAGYYWLDGSAVDTSVAGEYPVAIKYRNDDGSDTTIGEVTVVVGSNYASIANKSGTVAKNAGLTTVVSVISGEDSHNATFTFNGESKNISVGMLTDSNGNPVDTSKPGVYSDLTLTYQGVVICDDYTLTVADSNPTLDYPIYPDEGSVKVDKNGQSDNFKGTGVAEIELSATAIPLDKGVDLIIIMDLSSSMRYFVNSSEYASGPKYNTDGTLNPNTIAPAGDDRSAYTYTEAFWKNTRMYAMEEALREMLKTLSESSVDGDIRVAMADFGDLDHYEFEDAVLDHTIGTPAGAKPYWNADGDDDGYLEYEMSNHVNFVQGRDDIPVYKGLSQPYWLDPPKHNVDYYKSYGGNTRTYTGKLLPKIYTGSTKLNSAAFEDVDSVYTNVDNVIEQLRVMNGKRLGTNYDIGLETAYRLAHARQQANIAAGEDREIICIFMSDGAAMQYNYLSGRSQTEAWSQCIIGETDEILNNNADKYVITSDYGDTSVNQNPLLQGMILRLAELLNDNFSGRSSLLKPGSGNNYYPAYTGNSTDFFEQMKSIGVDCDWELLWQIAWKNYTNAESDQNYYNILNIPSLNHARNSEFCENFMKSVVTSMRQPSYDAAGKQYEYQTLSPYYYFYNAEGKNWWAEALKGDTNKLHPVVSKFAFHDSTEWGEDVDFYYGDVRNNYDTDTGLALDGKDYIAGFRGLDIDLYTIGFSLGTENRIEYSETSKVLENLASGPAYYYEAASGESLTTVLKSITGSMSVAATGAYFTDTMGPEYDLSTEKVVNGKEVNENPTIKVLEYTLDENGDRTGEPIVRETITFEGGKVAKSDQIYDVAADGTKTYPDIWDDSTGLISGKFVRYNTNTNKAVDLKLDNSERVFSLAPETFFWIVGTIGETEMVLEYQVYLTGSMEGNRETGFYDTNTNAVLNYINYLGNNCRKDTVTPAFPWPEAVVGYGFYLVDADGNPVNIYGDICSFTDSKKLSGIKYIQMLLNGDQKNIAALDKLPAELDGIYDLYDPAAQYEIKIDSKQSENYWKVTTGEGAKSTTYVTNYGGAPTTNDSKGDSNVAYDRTVVWFALVVTPKLEPDVVVIDYGLPVKINVLANDGDALTDVAGITKKKGSLPSNGLLSLAEGFTDGEVSGEHGKLKLLDSNEVEYMVGSMKMPSEDVFMYAAKDKNSGRYYYSTVTVIPATSIYYEDSFLTYKVFDFETDAEVTSFTGNKSNNKWTAPVTPSDGQGQDRPGADVNDALGNLDADNVYGYDGAYTNMTTYSMGTAMKVTADSDAYATATFDFWGTGFDIISVTSGDTGVIKATVYKKSEYDAYLAAYKTDPTTAKKPAKVKSLMVDTYYGYAYGDNDGDGDNEWYVDKKASATLYQVPVLKMQLSEYGQYTAIITVSYTDFLDNRKDGAYDFYLDAIRIYDPANDGKAEGGKYNEVIKDAYVKDGEGWPEYFELRNLIITRNDFDSLNNPDDEVNGIVFIDGIPELTDGNASAGDVNKDPDVAVTEGKTPAISDYTNFGPNNELYLAKGQAIAFKLNIPKDTDNDGKDDLAKIHLALKTVGGKAAKVTVYDANDSGKTNVLSTESIQTATDLYYDITGLNGKTVVIKNTGDGILSITNIKVTHTAEHVDSTDGYLTVSAEIGKFALMSLRTKPTEPEETEPETTVPTEPEVTEPETTVPTEPEVTEPETTVPTEPEVTEPETTVPTEPEVTEPETTEPTEPEPTETEATKPTKPSKPGSTKPTKPNSTKPTKPESTESTEPKETEPTEPEATEPKATEPEVTEPEAGEPTVTEPEATEPEATEPEATEQEVFRPRRFKVKLPYDSVKVDSYVVIKITTKRDVDMITINGQEVTQYKENHWTATRKWVVKVKMSALGEQTIDVVTWNADGIASEAIEKTVTVTERYTSIRNWIEDLVSGMLMKR